MEYTHKEDITIALAGNPNVGKSTVFNGLTGLKQHTGNWAGKTVSIAEGYVNTISGNKLKIIDIPGTYSLIAHSEEEEVAADAICFSSPDAVVIVCDAGCLERNLNLVLQILEVTGNAVVCVNLIDEAKRAGISIDKESLSKQLDCPVVLTAARNKTGLEELKNILFTPPKEKQPLIIRYDSSTEEQIERIIPLLPDCLNKRWAALRLLEGTPHICDKILSICGNSLLLKNTVNEAKNKCNPQSADAIFSLASSIAKKCVKKDDNRFSALHLKIDKLLTGRFTGIPLMLLLLATIFYITIRLANYPSEWLSSGLFFIGDKLKELLLCIRFPSWLISMLIDGIYRVLVWVISVMLPPMAIFFPLFTLLEDAGYLPRIAFNMDSLFKKCNACGKQSLTMAMGLGCNAAGVTGCRIIDSPRERYIAIITNSMMPCNGRFPAIMTLISLFITAKSGVASAGVLTCVLILGVAATFFSSWLLSKTFLKGKPSSFTLELPPFRRPKIGEVLVRSMLDRTLFVLKRAIVIAAPAGLVMWILANTSIADATLLTHICNFLTPPGKFIGLDGEILTAFILGLPANEIVIPIAVMAYTSSGTIVDTSSMQLATILAKSGWTHVTAVCTIIFSLLHWPCSTTLMTIKKETNSWFYTFLSILIPTSIGVGLCLLVRIIFT